MSLDPRAPGALRAGRGDDIDGDGLPDLGVEASSRLYFFLSPPTTGLTTADAYTTSSDSGSSCLHGSDTDGDGADEMFYRHNDDVYRYSLPLPSGALGTAEGRITFNDDPYYSVAPGDLSGDGVDDVVFGIYGSVYLFTGGAL